jgi:hypothetical protein
LLTLSLLDAAAAADDDDGDTEAQKCPSSNHDFADVNTHTNLTLSEENFELRNGNFSPDNVSSS